MLIVFGTMATALFKSASELSDKPWYLRYSNFQTLIGTTEALFVFLTGDGWDVAMVGLRDAMPPNDQWRATAFFIMFQVFSQVGASCVIRSVE